MLLALDTATATASVAVYDLDDDQLLAELTWQARRRQTQDVLIAVQDLLRMCALAPHDLDALAVTTGPGSFTGVRIGISLVKGLGLGLPAPPRVVGVPTLSVSAAPWLTAAGTMVPPATVCACIQAGRGRFNWAWFGPGDILCRPQAAEHQAGDVDALLASLIAHSDGPVWLVGEARADLRNQVRSLAHVTVMDDTSSLRRAGSLAYVASLRLARGLVDALESLQPIYLRNP